MKLAATVAVLLSAAGGAVLPGGTPARLRRVTVAAHSGRSTVGGQGRLPRQVRSMLRKRRSTAAGREAVVGLCLALSAELAAGASPAAAFAAVTGPGSSAERIGLSAADVGGESPEISAALRRAAGRPGCDGLLLLDACWRVSDRSGSGLAGPLTRLADALRDDEQVRREVAAQLAGPRATVLLLASLPLAGLLLGGALGVSPFGWLAGSPSGRLCLSSGALLEAGGCWWMSRIVRAALPP